MNFNQLEWFLFIVAVLFVPLIMLNMLIAIMGDTYDRVKEESIKRDFHEIVWLLFEYELVGRACCCRRDKKWKYLIFSKEKRMNLEATMSWEGRIKAIKQEINRINRDVSDLVDKKFLLLDKKIDRSNSALIKKIDLKFDQISDKVQNVEDTPLADFISRFASP